MILIAGGTGTLGTEVVRLLSAGAEPVRVLTRERSRAAHLGSDVEVIEGDVRDPASLPAALTGVDIVVSAVQGFAGRDASSPAAVDAEGNANLVAAAVAAGVRHFVLISVHGARPSAPMGLARAKHAAEQALIGGGLAWTIIRPTAFMETWAQIVGVPLLRTGRTRVFGRGANPINFVSVRDVAAVVATVVSGTGSRGTVLEVAGPEDLTMNAVAALFAARSGRPARVSHVPLPVMRLAALVLRPFGAALARQIAAGVIMDTGDLRYSGGDVRLAMPAVPRTRFADVADELEEIRHRPSQPPVCA